MENFDINALKEKYRKLKIENYDNENELRVLIKAREKFPDIIKEKKWTEKYRDLMQSISEEMELFKSLKSLISNEELEKLSYEIKSDIFKKIYYENNLDRYELEKEQISPEEYNIQNTSRLYNNLEPEVQKKIEIDKSKFAKMILDEKNLLKKIDLVSYLAKKDNNFFDTSVIYKAEIAKLFVNKMNFENINENEVITAALMYTCKKIDSAQEIERLKNEKYKDFEYLKSLGFSDRFCKMCIEHTRYNQPEGDYVREPEGDILELVENYVGLTMHREDRMAFPIDEAVDLIEHKNLQGYNNIYLNDFKKFVNIMEKIQINCGNTNMKDGILHTIYNNVNSKKRDGIVPFMHDIVNVNKILAEQNIIIEPESTRVDVDKENFEKMSKIEELLQKSKLNNYLKSILVEKRAKLQEAKKLYNEAINQ